MKRRYLLKGVAALPFLATTAIFAGGIPAAAGGGRVRPSDPAWPKAKEWEGVEARGWRKFVATEDNLAGMY